MEIFTTAHALCVGVSTYEDASVTDLPDAVIHDAQDVGELLKDRSRCGYPTDNVECLVSGVPGKEPTKQAILDALDLLADTSRVNGEATVLLYFSCHGGQAGSDTYL